MFHFYSTYATEYWYAPAEYFCGKHGQPPQLKDMMFHGRFAKPSLDFLCKHDALLHLEIEQGHFNLDYDETRDPDEVTANE